MRRLSPPRPVILAAVVAACAAVGAVLVAGPLASDSPAAPGSLRVVAVGGGPPQLHDGQGRAVLLRGVAVTGLVRYGAGYAENPPVQAGDFAEIAALGLDFVRLPVSWSAIEPAPRAIDAAYLHRVAATVTAAQRQGLRVVIDLHLDRFSAGLAPGVEADGAPAWATLVPAGCPARPSPDDCQRAAWQSFWTGQRVAGSTLQDHYVAALLALSRALRGDDAVAGLELMNNPASGGEPSPAFEADQLWPFYRRAIAALRGDGETRPLWIDRAASAEQRDGEVAGLPARLSRDANLVLAAHDYVGVFAKPDWPAGGIARLQHFYAGALGEAAARRMALVIGEWGAQAGRGWDGLLAAKLHLQDSAGLGSAFWMFKQRSGFYGWNLVSLDGGLRADSARAQLLSAPYPRAVPGRLLSCAYVAGRLAVRYDAPRSGLALLWSGTQVRAGGARGVARPLTHATVDGRVIAVTRAPRVFATRVVSLAGDVVGVRVPAGTHTLVLS